MATLRSALGCLAPATGVVCEGVRGSPGPSVTARRNFFTHSDGFRMFMRERFSLKRPETWFLGIGMAFGGIYRVVVQKEWKEASSSTILKDEEEGKALKDPIT
ncbi:unnamed protein product [Alopecurus aequalis]